MSASDSDKKNDHLSGKSEHSILGSFRKKLVAKKEQWAREQKKFDDIAGRAPKEILEQRRTDGRLRLPPGQRVDRNEWPVLDLGMHPVVVPEDWTFSVQGLVENPIRWRWADLMAMPQTELVTDIHCVTAWSVLDCRFTGVTAKDLLRLVRPKGEARHLMFHAHDGYTVNVPLSVFNDDDVMLVHCWNGVPLPREHGGPVRVVIPKLYFWKSAKWVKNITFLDRDTPGYWEARGYHNHGDPWKSQRYRREPRGF